MFKMLLFFLKIPHLWLFTPESWKWNHVLLKCFWRVWVQKACFHHVTVTCRINMSWRRSSPSLKMIPMVSLDKVVGSARLNCSHKGFFLDAITLHCSIYEQWQFHHQLRKLNKSYWLTNCVNWTSLKLNSLISFQILFLSVFFGIFKWTKPVRQAYTASWE